jgi:hypothetical protein
MSDDSVTPERGTLTTITAIMLSVFLMGSGTALQTSAVSLRAGVEGFSAATIGLIHSVVWPVFRGITGGVPTGSGTPCNS